MVQQAESVVNGHSHASSFPLFAVLCAKLKKTVCLLYVSYILYRHESGNNLTIQLLGINQLEVFPEILN